MEALTITSADENLVRRELGEAAEIAGRLAQAQEAGQAITPLCDAFERLGQPLFSDPVRAVLVGLTPESTAAAVSALVGDDYNICRVIVPSRIGYTEILLQERGFSLDTGESLQEFDQAESFVAALEDEDLLQEGNPSSWMDPLRLQLPAPSRRRGLRLLVPESLSALVKKPALLSVLADGADWLFLCGPVEAEFGQAERDTLQLLMEQMVGLQCLVGNGKETGGLPSKGWWLGWKVVCSLSPMRMNSGADVVDARLELLTQPSSELRRFIQETRRQRELEAGVELLQGEVEQADVNLQNQKKLQQSGLITGSGQHKELRREVDKVRETLQEEMEALRRSVEEESKRLLVAGGGAYQRMDELAGEIDAEDILQDARGNVIKLTLDEGCQDGLVREVEAFCRQRLIKDLKMIQEALDLAGESLRKRLTEQAGIAFKPTFPGLDEKAFWSSMTGLARPEIRYRGEMPKPSIGSRLGKARQGIFGILMLGMVFGAIGTLLGEQTNLRTYLYAAMLPLMIIGFFWTYVSIRKQQNLTIEKELEKLHDATGRELRRVVADLFREQQNLVGQYLQKVMRTLAGELGDQVQARESLLQAEQEKRTRASRDQEKSIEQRLRQLDERRREASGVAGRMPAIRTALEKWLRDWVVRFNKK